MKLSSLALIAAALAISSVHALPAEVSLPAIFGDHMVLQQGKSIPVWGTASPGEAITVALGKDKARTTADAQGQWRVDLKAVKPNATATTLTVTGRNSITLTDVLIGDVWIASGQSNMEFGVKMTYQAESVVASATEPLLRIFNVPKKTAVTPQKELPVATGKDSDYNTRWLVCTPESLTRSGGWNGFTAVGFYFGREIQRYTHQPVGVVESSWGGTPAEAWTSIDGLRKDAVLAHYVTRHDEIEARYAAAIAAQPDALVSYQARAATWDRDVKPANDAAMKDWEAAVAQAAADGKPAPRRPTLTNRPTLPDPTGGPGTPASLYDGMIAPLVPYAIKGAIWYQGEANGNRGVEYRTLFPRMIADWRQHWGEGEFPFLYVQLADWSTNWTLVREAQTMTLATPATGMAVAIDIGSKPNIHPIFKEPVGHRLALAAEHIAYGSKAEYTGPVYKNITLEADTVRVHFDHAAGLKISSYPITGTEYQPVPTDQLHGFTIAGADLQWHEATAVIDGESVVVRSVDVTHPVAVRYGWEPAFVICNLYNAAELPASPFRSDDWPVSQ